MESPDAILQAELQRLYAELSVAYTEAAAALKTNPPRHSLEGAALEKFLAADEKTAAIVRRIKQIQGLSGKPGNG